MWSRQKCEMPQHYRSSAKVTTCSLLMLKCVYLFYLCQQMFSCGITCVLENVVPPRPHHPAPQCPKHRMLCVLLRPKSFHASTMISVSPVGSKKRLALAYVSRAFFLKIKEIIIGGQASNLRFLIFLIFVHYFD